MKDNMELEQILRERKIPTAATNLSARIIDAASLPNKKSFLERLLQEVGTMIILPRPAYVLGIALAFGLMIGAQVDINVTDDLSAVDWFAFSDIEEGDWL